MGYHMLGGAGLPDAINSKRLLVLIAKIPSFRRIPSKHLFHPVPTVNYIRRPWLIPIAEIDACANMKATELVAGDAFSYYGPSPAIQSPGMGPSGWHGVLTSVTWPGWDGKIPQLILQIETSSHHLTTHR
ncbi:hypothetical protein CFAM422_002641 [Trichoderma lentiforme]|uniref:Uncharacterized protein n=1 Tax=Trichoderma lentiforme TaxID=1567552 RepID=A0A9P5CHT5_9HYPO|nr:hypothetical protein CFAM422_002641 [Trichoderma lentiforme]